MQGIDAITTFQEEAVKDGDRGEGEEIEEE
jgi:hypothetical protein